MQTYNDAWMGWIDERQCYEIHDEHDFFKRQDVNVKDLDPSRYVMEFGEYKGSNISDLAAHDPEYLARIYNDEDIKDILLKQCIYNATL